MNTDQLYRDCKSHGLSAVARRLGIPPDRLVDALHRAGVAEGCPSPGEIRDRCREVQRTWTDGTRNCRDR
ncbi:MAG: hypothetical protein NTY17_11260 [Planctomycetia bacterium]|jgi:hypothetical protein|nr:hypothetical protein [Planctomycetia bacterium]